MANHPCKERIYLVLDAVDESNDHDQDNILQLLADWCSKSRCCVVKIFLSSRPIGRLQTIIGTNSHILLQKETRGDIKKFASSFLGPDLLNLRDDFLQEATNYIVDEAKGVFTWANLIKEELRPFAQGGYRQREIMEKLKSFPTDLEELYEHILRKLQGGSPRDIRDGLKMLQFALFARRSLTVEEYRHALAISDLDQLFRPCDASFESELIHGMEDRIIYCGGNFLEIKRQPGKFLQINLTPSSI